LGSLALAIVQRNRLLQTQIVHRQDIGSQEVENEEHFRCPPADSPDIGQLGDDRFVTKVGPASRIDAPGSEVPGQIRQIFDLASRKAASRKLRSLHGRHRPWRHLSHAAYEAAPNGIGRLDRNLLPDD